MSDPKLYRLKRFLKLPLPTIGTGLIQTGQKTMLTPKPIKSNRTDLKSASLLPKCPLETVGSNWISSSRRSSAVVVETTSCWTGVEVVTSSTSLVLLLETLVARVAADLDSSSMNGTASPSNTDDKLELTNQVSLMVILLFLVNNFILTRNSPSYDEYQTQSAKVLTLLCKRGNQSHGKFTLYDFTLYTFI